MATKVSKLGHLDPHQRARKAHQRVSINQHDDAKDHHYDNYDDDYDDYDEDVDDHDVGSLSESLASVSVSLSTPKPMSFVRPQPCYIRELYREDLFSSIFQFFDGHTVAMVATVSSDWCQLLKDSIVWQNCCYLQWNDSSHNASLLSKYHDSYHSMVQLRPHVRYDGIYLLETKYWKQGGERFGERTVRLIECNYYRYLNFLPSGVVYYALLNQPPSLLKPMSISNKYVYRGQWLYSEYGHHVYVKVTVKHETQYMKVKLLSTEPGRWNRLELVEFRGKGPRDRGFFYYPLPHNPFLFYCTSGVMEFSKEELKERMQLLLESNEYLEPPATD